MRPIANKYREGEMKRTLKRKVCETVERETDGLGILLRNDRKSRQAVILGDQVLTCTCNNIYNAV